MALTSKQERRLWRCLDRMRWQPENPMAIEQKMVEFRKKVDASTSLKTAVYAAVEREGAEVVNEYLREAEEALDLEPIEPDPDEETDEPRADPA